VNTAEYDTPPQIMVEMLRQAGYLPDVAHDFGGSSEEFFNVTPKQAATFFGLAAGTIRRWIKSGLLRGTRKPLRTSLAACRELRDSNLVEQPAPANTGKPRPYSRRDRQPWEFIDPSKSGSK